MNAICMACGCLPFAQSKSLTHVVHVTRKTNHGIRHGHEIRDADPTENDRSKGERNAEGYLSSTPSITRKNYYHLTFNAASEEGTIRDSPGNRISSWPEVVARIAFGGFVPFATRELVDSVRFTVQGRQELSLEDIHYIRKTLRRLIISCHRKHQEKLLFGQFIEDEARTRKVTVTYDNPSRVDTARAGAIFARYMTLLECMTAKIPNGDKPRAAYEACCNEVRSSYKEALDKEAKGSTKCQPEFLPDGRSKSLQDQADKIFDDFDQNQVTADKPSKDVLADMTSPMEWAKLESNSDALLVPLVLFHTLGFEVKSSNEVLPRELSATASQFYA
ncbi:hypothetical protein TSTA_102880 [Talaromyces stipitatus ATCC 10500]|uniref:Uncharacterized protein n=1 Tax=Talaromyces stipitatus (strain ATCC 10500 / CBS 375.48 / QM 6759 / NRRL 1006) TaxID=441959 RepID=B8MNH2_TALSN|nr:uncharacterized protein TSTA_102880 [Talaromyces stipitatus ATCC 10500]EED14061.1 hypothetical protein TSTA_102880 [Talaromyces stipitatus ATCC 10500]